MQNDLIMHNEEPQMTDISMVGPDGGEQMLPATGFASPEETQ